MNPQDWPEVQEILNTVLELEPAKRQNFLAGLGANGVRREVESLLDCESSADGFMASPAAAFSAEFFKDSYGDGQLIDQKIGNYRITGELGRGGMGSVYLAERDDGKYRQKVAVKLLKRELNTADIRRRFAQERQILAGLTHPNIARLLDAGTTDDGIPFLVMEWVDGAPVNEFCGHAALNLNERLTLFRTICDAVAFAHRNLIVHRDLKPSNILVTKEGVPKLLDFGISKLLTPEYELDDTHTITKLGAMTPEYASPEQLRGESVTTATDVYSLGVILYELLTDHRPFKFKKHNAEEIIHAICTTEPRPPSGAWLSERGEAAAGPGTQRTNAVTEGAAKSRTRRVQPSQLKGDLDNIILKALKKEPHRRYSSVEQFSEDIRRHLADLPVLARPDTLAYRAAKFASRNRIVVAATVLIALTLVGGVLATLWQARRAEASRARAEKRFADIRQLSNALLFDISPKIERLRGATDARRSVVTQSLQYLDSLSAEAGDDLGLQSELASAYEKIGDLQGNPTNPNLGDGIGAIASFEKARAIRRKLLENDLDNFEQLRRLAANHQSLSRVRWQANELDEATKEVETAYRMYESLLARQPDSVDLQFASAQVTYDIGNAQMDNSKYSDAINYFRKSLAIVEPRLASDPDNPEVLKLAGNLYQKLGSALSWNSQQQEAEVETEKSIRIYESLMEKYPQDVTVANGAWQTYWLASSTYEEQDNAKSYENALKALKIIQATVDADPADAQARKRLARSFSSIGQAANNTGRFDEAIVYLEKAVAESTRLFESDPGSGNTKSNIATARMRLAEARAKKKDFRGAIAELEAADIIYVELIAAEPTDHFSLHSQAISSDFKSEIYDDWAKSISGNERYTYQEKAKGYRAGTLKILIQLDAVGSLAEFDRKWLEKLKAAVEKDNL